MIAYIIFNIWDISTNKKKAMSLFVEKHLPTFFLGAQPDISLLQLKCVQISKTSYNLLQSYLVNQDKSLAVDIEKILCSLFKGSEEKYIYCFAGNEVLDVADFYLRSNNIQTTDDEYFDTINDVISNMAENPNEFAEIIHHYIEFLS